MRVGRGVIRGVRKGGVIENRSGSWYLWDISYCLIVC